ncbi:MAG: type IV pili methyl-accepting chemotaxis transducer N-terminal domain-containing protein [Anaerolineales bacterium]|nr:type IV pili methyl-accepting chemotaxis transducer N-terminal domain-containing protein [Anaerolineales bacterium]
MKRITSSLNGRMSLLFLSFFLLVTISVGATAWVVDTQNKDALIINLAGRQRMLIQQMTREALLFGLDGDEQTLRSLENSTDTFDRTLNALIQGGQTPYLPDQVVTVPATKSGVILTGLHQVQSTWDTFSSYVEAIIVSEPADPGLGSSVDAVEQLSPVLLLQADEVVRMYESASEEKVERLTWIQATFFLSALTLLVAGFIITKKSVISPLHSLALYAEKIGQGNLGTRVDVSGPFEIDSLAQSLDTMRAQLLSSRDELEEQVQRRTRELAALHEVSRDITSKLEIEYVLRSVTDKARKLLDCETAFICLLDEVNETLSLKAMSGPQSALGDVRVQVQDSHAQLVLTGSEAVFCNGVGCTSQCRIIAEPHHRSHLASSLRVGERVIGALCAASPEAAVFSQEDANLLTKLADSAAVALENARLYREAERAATLEERHRIAAEIHDGVAQILSYLELEVDELVGRIENDLPGDSKTELLSIREAVSQAGQEARKSITRLHEEVPAPKSLQCQLENAVADYNEACEFVITLDAGDSPPLALPHSDATHILRVLQEALMNARRHAQAKKVTIFFDQVDQEHVLTIEDDGLGFDPEAPHQDDRPHFGLSIMKARAIRLEGDLKVISQAGKGTRIALTWPVQIQQSSNLIEAMKG